MCVCVENRLVKAKVAGYKSSSSLILRIVHASNVLQQTLPIDRWAKRVAAWPVYIFIATDRQLREGERMKRDGNSQWQKHLLLWRYSWTDIGGRQEEQQEGAAQV